MRRKCRDVTPTSSAPCRAVMHWSFACLKIEIPSLSLWLNVSISFPGESRPIHLEQTDSERGHFYFNQTAHCDFNAQWRSPTGLTNFACVR